MEWSFDSPGGVVTVRREGDRAVCQAISRRGGDGLYKAWLEGSAGRCLLGTLIPEGGALRLRRVMSVAQLERQGVWPPTCGEVLMAFPVTGREPPPGWQWQERPGRLMGDSVLSRALHGCPGAFFRREGEGFFLAFPWEKGAPFPIPPLFCLAWTQRLGERWYVVFRFSGEGKPLLHN